MNSRKVSQERVIGISFVDVLIQAVFVLLVALMAGYIDPVEREKISKYEEAGKDLCTKLNKDSAEACRDFVAVNNIGIVGNFGDAGETVCSRVGARDGASCIQAVDKLLGKGSQLPCLRSPNQNLIQASTRWEVKSPSEMIFLGFTPKYFEYLRQRNDGSRLASAQRLHESAPVSFRPSEIDASFGFIREPECFHTFSAPWGKYSQSELQEAYRALARLRDFSRN